MAVSGTCQVLLLLVKLTAVASQERPIGHVTKAGGLEITFRNLVPVRTLDGDIAWIEARFLNETHDRNYQHRRKPDFASVDKMSVLLPVLTFLVPFSVWMFCMVVCLNRSQQRHIYY
ncbi:hypothetical protein HPB47_003954 [Ixodes persulcatus]|uniref:Uncharacterized protein n=1 Tax=Ixodes persulcatus TaxID=34615 RepID=A0AC60PGY5_IXOPE|nr:hypothetical protein HPB47_003954 [Ixodes persulcatus]